MEDPPQHPPHRGSKHGTAGNEHPAVPPEGLRRGFGSCRALDELFGAAMLHPERRVTIPRSGDLHPKSLHLQRHPRSHQHAGHFSRREQQREAPQGPAVSRREFHRDFHHLQRHAEHGRAQRGQVGGGGVSSQVFQQDALPGRACDRVLLLAPLLHFLPDPADDGLGGVQPHVRLLHAAPGR